MVKMIAIFIMVIIHTLEHGEADLNSGLGYFFDSIAGSQFGAPVFMICMGIGITYRRKNDAATVMKRGGMLLLAGYLLNVVARCRSRFCTPSQERKSISTRPFAR
jgi:hypothetical protein